MKSAFNEVNTRHPKHQKKLELRRLDNVLKQQLEEKGLFYGTRIAD